MTSNIKPLLLHSHNMGPNPYKVALALEYLSLPYQIKNWQFGDQANGVKGSKFLSINENGRVPALEDPNTGVVSWESGACINYLLRVYDSKTNKLGPKSDDEQARVDFDKWIFFLVSTLGPMQGQLNWFTHYHGSKNEDARARYEQQSHRCYEVLEGQLQKSGGKTVLGGDRVSAVDLHMYPWVKLHGFAGVGVDKYPAVDKWIQRLGELPEFKSVYDKIPKGEEA
ncbi:hypothetical protein MBLNU230_g0414t1 [Neophaeotheca triangularis]